MPSLIHLRDIVPDITGHATIALSPSKTIEAVSRKAFRKIPRIAIPVPWEHKPAIGTVESEPHLLSLEF